MKDLYIEPCYVSLVGQPDSVAISIPLNPLKYAGCYMASLKI